MARPLGEELFFAASLHNTNAKIVFFNNIGNFLKVFAKWFGKNVSVPHNIPQRKLFLSGKRRIHIKHIKSA